MNLLFNFYSCACVLVCMFHSSIFTMASNITPYERPETLVRVNTHTPNFLWMSTFLYSVSRNKRPCTKLFSGIWNPFHKRSTFRSITRRVLISTGGELWWKRTRRVTRNGISSTSSSPRAYLTFKTSPFKIKLLFWKVGYSSLVKAYQAFVLLSEQLFKMEFAVNNFQLIHSTKSKSAVVPWDKVSIDLVVVKRKFHFWHLTRYLFSGVNGNRYLPRSSNRNVLSITTTGDIYLLPDR